MITKCYSANVSGGLVKEIVLTILTKKTVVGYVPLKATSLLEIQPVLGLHAEAAPSILVKMPMQRPSDASKRNATLKELSTNEEAVTRFQRTEDISPKPPNIVSKN